MTERLRGRRAVDQRRRRMSRTDWCCEMCAAKGFPRAAEFVDHIVPLALGGSDEDSNTRNLCAEHHDEVTRQQFGLRPKQKVGPDGWPE